MKFQLVSAKIYQIAFLLFLSSSALATPDRVIAFGDSLSDRGNLLTDSFIQTSGTILVPPPTRYSDGRFTNGLLWLETLAEWLGDGSTLLASQNIPTSSLNSAILTSDHSISFAYGGAGSGAGLSPTPDGFFLVPGVLEQVRDFGSSLDIAAAPNDVLYSVWGGANDYLFGLDVDATPIEISELIFGVVENIGLSIQELYGMGAREFLIPNLPVLGAAPLVEAFALANSVDPALLAAQLDAVVAGHNALLAELVASLGVLPDVTIIELDVHTLSQQALAALGPGPGPASGCLFSPVGIGDPSLCGDVVPFDSPSGFYWDELHPSDAVHELLGKAAVRAVPVTPVILLLAIGWFTMWRSMLFFRISN